MEKDFKLCYVENGKAWFCDDFEHIWGDDWNDKPYEDNAGTPYDEWYENEQNHPIKLKTLMFETNDWSLKYPCDLGSFSVEQINKGTVAWIITDDYAIPAKTTYEDFIKIIEEHDGTIYVPRKEIN